MAKTRVDSVVSNPGAGSGTPYFDPYSSLLDFTGADHTVAMVIFAGLGAVISFAVFNKMIKSFQRNSAMDDSF